MCSAAAWRSRRVAAGRLAVQAGRLGLVAYSADVFQVRFWYAYLAAGLVVPRVGGGRFIRPPERGAARNRAIKAGSHRVLGTVMLVVASAMILCGLAAIVTFGLYQIQPPGSHRAGPCRPAGTWPVRAGQRPRCRIWPRTWRRRGLGCWSWARSSSWSPGAGLGRRATG